MRVISGAARGCRLTAPKGVNTRPTADRLKENLFNILQPRIAGAYFLDLFSGSGAIGIEALSRGADAAVFVERDFAAVSVIRENLRKTKLAERAGVLALSAGEALARLFNDKKTFDIIFMDPPYGSELAKTTFALLARYNILKDGGILIAELPSEGDAPVSEIFAPLKSKTYGSTRMVFYEGTVPGQL
ncbi:MAG: 16S rRNA (guanine(966)-N(2))-methyltransferase RsmD [Clostridiales bacterium]|jgi:16S rRNA (guanine(966)-N(2))-methyltransferase RsmD|nr:16S rRNA (guanine(966)-N(2))-methyltransferase RsmD [Clostridiales bacterium]